MFAGIKTLFQKQSVIVDISIMIASLVYYFLNESKINSQKFSEETFNTIRILFTIECAVLVLFQIVLILIPLRKT